MDNVARGQRTHEPHMAYGFCFTCRESNVGLLYDWSTFLQEMFKYEVLVVVVDPVVRIASHLQASPLVNNNTRIQYLHNSQYHLLNP